MLGIAYAASIGGISTIVGSPTNLFLVSYLRDSIATPYRMEFGFSRWLMIGVPVTLIYLPITWWLLTRLLMPLESQPLFDQRGLLTRELAQLGKPKAGEWITFVVFIITVVGWIGRPWLENVTWSYGGNAIQPFSGLTDEGISMTAALALFIIPVGFRPRTFVLNWKVAEQVPWGILILFGGGLSLARAIEQNGVADFLGAHGESLVGLPRFALVLIVTTFVIFFTELTSNTTTVTTLVPVLVALAPGLNVHPYLLAFPATIAASCAFMLPVATPPNAIVFASGYIALPQMIRAGVWLNLIGIVLISGLTMAIIGPLLGV
jgi:sodium-dependent dicarboxylate transporter 2/3/5